MQFKKSFLALCGILGLSLIPALPIHVLAAQVSLTWDDPQNHPADVGGYMLYYWQSHWDTPAGIDVGDRTTCTLIGLETGQTYAFAVAAYGPQGEGESVLSNVVTRSLPRDPVPVLESGGVSVDHNWKRVTFRNPFEDPIVIAQPLSSNGLDAAVIRIRDVNSSGFSIRVQEWDSLDGRHTFETVNYLVMERGRYFLPDGTQIKADRFATDETTDFKRVSFSQAFQTLPVVITTVSSFNGPDAVTGQIRNINSRGFEFRLQEQELNLQNHTTERINYIAWEAGLGWLDDVTFEVSTTRKTVTDQFYTISYHTRFLDVPAFLADIQTSYGTDPAALRWTNKNSSRIDIRIEEDLSSDSETRHAAEVIGYMLFGRTDLN